MIKSIGIKNFKSIGQMAHIPLKPITLIFGPNSAGKSSIIQSLLMLKQSLEGESYKVLKAKGKYVDLGNFKEFIHNHDLNNELSFRFGMSDFLGNMWNLEAEEYEGKEEWTDHIKDFEDRLGGETFYLEIEIKSNNDNKPKINGFNVFLGDKYPDPLIKYLPTEEFNIFHAKITERHPHWENKFSALGENFLKEILEETSKHDVDREKLALSIKRMREDPKNRELTASLIKSYTKADIYIDGIFPRYLRNFFRYDGRDEDTEEKFDVNEFFAPYDPLGTWAFNDYAFYLSQASGSIKHFFEKIDHIEPLRKAPKRYYSLVDDSELMEVYNDDSIFTYLENDWNLNKVNEALLKLNIGYRAEIRFFPEVDDDLCSINFINIHTGVASPMKDVGVGVSQVLPIVVACTSGKNKTFLVEQPELHLHPAAQTELGDLFIDSAKGENENSFVIETHSEHLILRLLRRIRETADGELPEGCTLIKPEDIAVLYVQPGPNGAEIIELPVNEDGQFDRPWPDGFFAERAKELF